MPENQLRHVDIVLLVYLNRNAATIVHNADFVLLGINLDLNQCLRRITHFIVGRVDNDLVKDFEQGRTSLG